MATQFSFHSDLSTSRSHRRDDTNNDNNNDKKRIMNINNKIFYSLFINISRRGASNEDSHTKKLTCYALEFTFIVATKIFCTKKC